MNAAQVDAALAHVVVPTAVGEETADRALGWGFRLLNSGGRLELLAVADEDVLSEARRLVGEAEGDKAFGPEHILRAVLREIGPLVASAQHQGHAQDSNVDVETGVGHFVPQVLKLIPDDPQVVIWEARRDPNSPSFHRGTDLLLASRHPVLFVVS